MTFTPVFRNGVPFFLNGLPSFCKEDCECKSSKCEHCCAFMFMQNNDPDPPTVWGEFNTDGDLFETLTYPGTDGSTITETITIIVPTKFSRYICDGEAIRVELEYSTTKTSGDRYLPDVVPFVSWGRAWTAQCEETTNPSCVEGTSIGIQKFGIIEDWGDDVEELAIDLDYSACWEAYESNVSYFIAGSRNYGEPRTLYVKPCVPDAACCLHEYECANCCIYLTSAKIIAANRGLSVPEVAGDASIDEGIGLQNEVVGSKILYVAEHDNGSKLYVFATPAGGAKRTVCPEIDDPYADPTNAGNTLQLDIVYVPGSLNPNIDWDQTICIEFNPLVWELAGVQQLNCGGDVTVCLPVSGTDNGYLGGATASAELNLRCFPFGVEPQDIAAEATINVVVDDSPTDVNGEDYVLHEGLNVKIPFGSCGSDGYECCPDLLPPCEDCCMVLDEYGGNLIDLEINGIITATIPICNQQGVLLGSLELSILGSELCKDAPIQISLDNPSEIAVPICITVDGPFKRAPNAEPEPDSRPSVTTFCWQNGQDQMAVEAHIKCQDVYEGAEVIITAGSSTAIFKWRGCPEANCCCTTYVACCDPKCHYNIEIPIEPVIGPDGYPVSEELAKVIDFVGTIVTGGKSYRYEQDGPSLLNYALVQVNEIGCPDAFMAIPATNTERQFLLTVKGYEDNVYIGDFEVTIGTCGQAGNMIRVSMPAGPGAGSTFELAKTSDCPTLVSETTDLNGDPVTIEFDIEGVCGWVGAFIPGTLSCENSLLYTTIDGVKRRVTSDELPEGFCTGEEI